MEYSYNLYDWLGYGIYFWEQSQQRALDFAMEVSGRSKRVVVPAVIGAVIVPGYCLDLLTAEGIAIIDQAYQTFIGSCLQLSIRVPHNRKSKGSAEFLLRDLDCAVIEALHAYRVYNNKQAFDSIRCAFIEGQPLYANSGFYTKTHIQLCVRNPNCIKGYFRPRVADPAWPVP